MGMPSNVNLLSVKSKNTISADLTADRSSRVRHATGSPTASSGSNQVNSSITRKYSAPELLPPIGIKPSTSTYSSPDGNTLNYPSPPLDPSTTSVYSRRISHQRTKPSQLSPTSTISSPDRGLRSAPRLSPVSPNAVRTIGRSRTWTGDLSSGEQTHESGLGAARHGSGAPIGRLSQSPGKSPAGELSIITEDVQLTETTSTSIIRIQPTVTMATPTTATLITATAPTPADQVRPVRKARTLISPALPHNSQADANNNNRTNQQAAFSASSIGQQKPPPPASKLSQENLLKLKHVSQGSLVSPPSQSSGTKASSDTGYDTDDEKEHRIVEWLIGVEESQSGQSGAESIASAVNGSVETVEKRDTAIHIVYDGD